jgi:CspA family cold shock protein
MMVTGTVKSFNYSKGYGFIRMDSGGRDVFVHLSAVREAGLANLRKGQRIGFEIFDNHGKVAARNLYKNLQAMHCQDGSWSRSRLELAQNARCGMKSGKPEQLAGKRTPIARAALELAIAEIIVERIVPTTASGANWALKGIKYGKADRDQCSATISTRLEEWQREFELSD